MAMMGLDYGNAMRGAQQASQSEYPKAKQYRPPIRADVIDAEFVEVTTPPLLGPPLKPPEEAE